MNKLFTLALLGFSLALNSQNTDFTGIYNYRPLLFKQTSAPACQVESYVLPFISAEGKHDGMPVEKALQAGESFSLHIPAGEALVLRYDPSKGSLTQFGFSAYQNLNEISQQAIDKAPDWLKNDLRNILAQLSAEMQDKWAGWIVRTEDPKVDEAAFLVASMSKDFLESNKAHTETFDKNLEFLFSYDELFDYVEIIDSGSANSNGSYYSTARYTMRDTAGHIYSYDIPKGIYYWYVVHPKINAEIPGFIKASMEPSANPLEDLKTPSADDAHFWREFVFEHGNSNIPNKQWYSGYPAQNLGIDTDTMELLVMHFLDSLKQQKYLWDGKGMNSLSMSYGRDTTDDHVIAQLNRLGASCIKYPAMQDRPTQPVRIMYWGAGNCGEHDMLNGAFGRTALLPTCGVMKLSRDHTWNAIYTNTGTKDSIVLGWVEWDSGLGGWFAPWQLGSGNHDRAGSYGVASVFMRRSDGVFYDQTENYSDGLAKVSIYVKDINGKAVDGAYVVLYAKGGSSGSSTDFFADNARNTASDGSAHFTIGENAIVNFGVYLERGKLAGLGDINKLDSLEVGKTYVHEVTLDSSVFIMDSLKVNSTTKKNSSAPHAGNIRFDLRTAGEIVFGATEFNDFSNISDDYVRVREYRDTESSFHFFSLDQENMLKYAANEAFTANDLFRGADSLNGSYTPASKGYTYYLVHNPNRANYIVLNGAVKLDGEELAITADGQNGLRPDMLTGTKPNIQKRPAIRVYPNPSTGHVHISSLKPLQSIKVYNAMGLTVYSADMGQSIEGLDLSFLPAGYYYLETVNTKGETFCQKLLLMD